MPGEIPSWQLGSVRLLKSFRAAFGVAWVLAAAAYLETHNFATTGASIRGISMFLNPQIRKRAGIANTGLSIVGVSVSRRCGGW